MEVHAFISNQGDVWLPVPEVVSQMQVHSMNTIRDFQQLAEEHAIATCDLIARTREATDFSNPFKNYTWISCKHLDAVNSLRVLNLAPGFR